MGFDGRSLNASKCPETSSKPTSARLPPDPMKRSRRGHPSTRLDHIAARYDPFRHASHEPFVSDLTVRRVGCCCRRRMSNREAALFFYYHVETCLLDRSTTCTNGVFHAVNASMPYTLTALVYPVSPPNPPRPPDAQAAWWPLRSSIRRVCACRLA